MLSRHSPHENLTGYDFKLCHRARDEKVNTVYFQGKASRHDSYSFDYDEANYLNN